MSELNVQHVNAFFASIGANDAAKTLFKLVALEEAAETNPLLRKALDEKMKSLHGKSAKQVAEMTAQVAQRMFDRHQDVHNDDVMLVGEATPFSAALLQSVKMANALVQPSSNQARSMVSASSNGGVVYSDGVFSRLKSDNTENKDDNDSELECDDSPPLSAAQADLGPMPPLHLGASSSSADSSVDDKKKVRGDKRKRPSITWKTVYVPDPRGLLHNGLPFNRRTFARYLKYRADPFFLRGVNLNDIELMLVESLPTAYSIMPTWRNAAEWADYRKADMADWYFLSTEEQQNPAKRQKLDIPQPPELDFGALEAQIMAADAVKRKAEIDEKVAVEVAKIKKPECVICMDKAPEYALQPCGHLCLCHACITNPAIEIAHEVDGWQCGNGHQYTVKPSGPCDCSHLDGECGNTNWKPAKFADFVGQLSSDCPLCKRRVMDFVKVFSV